MTRGGMTRIGFGVLLAGLAPLLTESAAALDKKPGKKSERPAPWPQASR
jgi:hypothetical protein